jgi:hypothetical protein
MEGVTADVYEDKQQDTNDNDANDKDTNHEDMNEDEPVVVTTCTSDDVPNVRPKRAASKRALENIRAVLDWEHCSKRSKLFKCIEQEMNNEFDALNKKRNLNNISTLINHDKVEGMQKPDSLGDTWDTDTETFTHDSSENDEDDYDDDDYSVGSFVVSDTAEVEYEEQIVDDCSDDDDSDVQGDSAIDDDGSSKYSDETTDDISDDNSDEDTVSVSSVSTSSDHVVETDQ